MCVKPRKSKVSGRFRPSSTLSCCANLPKQIVEPLSLALLRFRSDPLEVRERGLSVLCPGRVSLGGFPVGRAPSLRRVLGRYPRVPRLLRYYGHVRPLDGLLTGLRLVAFPDPPAAHHSRRGPVEVSRFPCRRHVLACRGLGPRLECSLQARVLRRQHRGHPRFKSALAPATCFFSGLFLPARQLVPLRFGSQVTLRPARDGLPRVELLLGLDLMRCSHLISPASSCRSPGAP